VQLTQKIRQKDKLINDSVQKTNFLKLSRFPNRVRGRRHSRLHQCILLIILTQFATALMPYFYQFVRHHWCRWGLRVRTTTTTTTTTAKQLNKLNFSLPL